MLEDYVDNCTGARTRGETWHDISKELNLIWRIAKSGSSRFPTR
jgi:hypothetical protein